MRELCFVALMCAAALPVIVACLLYCYYAAKEEAEFWKDWAGAYILWELDNGIPSKGVEEMKKYWYHSRALRRAEEKNGGEGV